MLYRHMEHLLEISVCFPNHVFILPTMLDKCGCFWSGKFGFVREKSDKCQGILLSIICGNPVSFFKVAVGSNIFQGGPTFSRGDGGSNCLFPIETHITCDFPGGSRPPVPPPPPPPPPPPLDLHLGTYLFLRNITHCDSPTHL